MPIPDENLTKCTLLVQRGTQTLTDYHKMIWFWYDFESKKYYQAFFLWKENKISLVYIKIICSLETIFLLYFKKVVAACKVSSVFNHISLNFL